MAAQPSPLSRKQQRRRNELSAQPAAPVQPEISREEQVRQRAYEIYLQRGEVPGCEMEDWLQAESEVGETFAK